ncbi:hypothetical protein [Rhodospirillum sp. A1_3_36]|uniref:hypothetical protein n=1 Tax=Rhodospirillum sp. A1_3_36 TaxID=3391666 RepID=UPI0039A5B06E
MRIRAISQATEPNDRVFTTIDGTPAKSLCKHLIADLLEEAGLREGAQGVARSTYSFRHTMQPLGCRKALMCISSPNKWALRSK